MKHNSLADVASDVDLHEELHT